MGTEIDRTILELLRTEINDEEVLELAEKLYLAYKEGGPRKVREYIFRLIKELGIENVENE